MSAQKIYNPDIAIHPGVSLRDELEFLGVSQKELSLRTGLSTKHINQIINGEDPITPETAIKLERAIKVDASFWNNLQKNYELIVAKIESEKSLVNEISEAKNYSCYKELAELGYVEKTSDWNERTRELLNFFGVSSLSYIRDTEAVAFRKNHGSINSHCLAAWLRCAEIESRKDNLPEFDRAKLKDLIPEFRKLTNHPKGFSQTLKDLAATAGVSIVYTPYFPKTLVNGSARWINNNPVIQINTRGVYADIFWFTLFHELGHILLHGLKDRFIDIDYKNESGDVKETEANDFASNTLIPPKSYQEFLANNRLNLITVTEFSKQIGVDKGIVLGRLAYEKKANWNQIASDRKRLVMA